MKRLVAACSTVLVLAACGQTTEGNPFVPVQRASNTLTDSSSAFGLKLLGRLLAEKEAGNVFISPLSATLMLSMAASASEGETKAAMLKVLGIDPAADADEQARQTIERLAKSDANAQLELAQAVWAQNGLQLNPAYVQRLQTDYQAQLANIDFASPAAPGIVNKWVSDKTHQKIKTLFDSFDPTTVGLIVNATYFHALWATEFKSMSQGVPFRQFDGSTSTPAYMHRDGDVVHFSTPSYDAVLLPYKGGRFSAVIILPKGILTAADFAAFLSAQVWSDTMTAFHHATGDTFEGKCVGWGNGDSAVGCEATLQMPKFKLEYEKDLTDTLAAMGMPSPASLPGFCSACFLTTVLQKTYLEVDEKGTTAAAVTGGVVESSLPVPVVVDRPFAFALVDNATDAPLFLGVLGNLA